LTLSFVVFAPVADGLNTTLIVQVAPAGTEFPQLLVSEKGCGLVLESATLVIGRAAPLVFVSVTDCDVLFVPWSSAPNAKDVGDSV
jgi:hypothetical protein